MVVSANGVSSYHGRTSTLFEEAIQERTLAAESRPSMPDEWTEKGLVAEAAKQGQLEELHYRAGTLDFDGVDPELGMHLLFLHWNRQHHSFLLTYRPAFMRGMAGGGPYFSKILLNAIYFGASKFSPRREVRRDPDDVRTAGWRFRERVRALLGGALDRSEITTIQALLVMTNSLFALGDERSAAWLYAGLAFRMIIDLGMHVDAPDLAGSPRKFSDEDVEIRRRVFWGAFGEYGRCRGPGSRRLVSLPNYAARVTANQSSNASQWWTRSKACTKAARPRSESPTRPSRSSFSTRTRSSRTGSPSPTRCRVRTTPGARPTACRPSRPCVACRSS